MSLPPINPGSQSDIFSASDIITITPSDSADLPFVARAIRVKVGGDLRITTGVNQVRDTWISDDTWLPITALRIHATGTTATDIEIWR